MAFTTPGTAVAGEVLTAAFWNEQVRDQFDELAPFFSAWTDYTPTISNVTQGNGTLVARYLRVGDRIIFYVKFTFGSTSAIAGSNPIGISLPVTMRETFAGSFTGALIDAGTNFYLPIVTASSTTSVNMYVAGTAGEGIGSLNFTTTRPFTWTTNDIISLAGIYEAA
jgi:hypothetical protein